MALIFKSRVNENASNLPNAVTAFTLANITGIGYKTFASSYTTGQELPYFANNGTLWESGIGTFTSGSPNSIVRTTFWESSTGSAIDFSAGASINLIVEWPAFLANSTLCDSFTSATLAAALTDETGTGSVVFNTTPTLTTPIIKGTTATDYPTLSAELLSAPNTPVNWTGSGLTWSLLAGFTDVITFPVSAVIGNLYQITYTITRSAGSVIIAFGGQATAALTASGTFGPKATTTAQFTITPLATFVGTVTVSLKQITAVSTPVQTLNSSDGIVRNEFRVQQVGNNFFAGVGSGGNNTSGALSVGVGYQCLYNTTTASYNTATGVQSLFNNTLGGSNTSTGYRSLYSNTTGSYNVAFGVQALYFNTLGVSCSAFGSYALQGNISGINNTGVGVYALYSNQSGANNTAIGMNALYNNTVSNNTAIGFSALQATVGGGANVAVGGSALTNNVGGGNNSSLGHWAGRFIADGTTANTTPNNCTYIGYNTKALLATDTNSTVIGYNAVSLGSNTTVIGGTATTCTQTFGVRANGAVAPTIASATTITPVNPIVFVSGIVDIVTITAPIGITTTGGSITLIPTAIWHTTTAGNIALATTAVVGRALIMFYDAGTAKWYPSY